MLLTENLYLGSKLPRSRSGISRVNQESGFYYGQPKSVGHVAYIRLLCRDGLGVIVKERRNQDEKKIKKWLP